jgi:isopenicillin N synthase-like dioxygenase
MFEVATAGYFFRATVHRVVAPTEGDRISLAHLFSRARRAAQRAGAMRRPRVEAGPE